MNIQRFRISNLHGGRSVDIPIPENKLLLVGVNGLGKTTIVNILYCFLSRQWSRLLEYRFDALAIDVSGRTISISYEDIEKGLVLRRARSRRLLRTLPQGASERLEIQPQLLDLFQDTEIDRDALADIADAIAIPVTLLERTYQHVFNSKQADLLTYSGSEKLSLIDKELRGVLDGQILYLPTYRRIERDLKTIFPSLHAQVMRFNQERSFLASRKRLYVELVEFGMEDVDAQFQQVLSSIKESAREQLNTLAGSYLRDVIREEAQWYDESVIKGLDDVTTTRILNRVDERTLSEDDKTRLRSVLGRLKNKTAADISESDRYIGHFFSRLVDIHTALSVKEASITRFVDVCNKYLSGKSLAFDDKAYQLTVSLSDGRGSLSLRELSSGEKQVVSLFSHLILGTTSSNNTVIIDEPELSLSVEWQRHFLSDIISVQKCAFLVAVTHSPFIFDNDLRVYARDLSTFVRHGRGAIA